MYVPSRQNSNQTGNSLDYQRRHRPDYILPILALCLVVAGLIVLFAISPALSAQKNVAENYFISRQAIALLLSVIVFFGIGKLPLNSWHKLEKPLIVLSIISALIVRLVGDQVNGAYRWIQIGGLSFQPAELIKFTLLIWLAFFFTDKIKSNTLKDFNKTLKPLIIALLLVGFVVAVLQSDLGSTAVMVAMIAAMSIVAGLPMKRIILVGAVSVMCFVIFISATPYRRQRLQTFLNPSADCQGAGYQTCQALIAVGSGGIFGLGLARSVQAYGYLPEAANDSIFAIYAEKFGFIGTVTLLGLIMAMFARLVRIAERAPDDYTRLIVVGVIAWFGMQSIINIGAMIGLLPLKGITLPFISYGGSSLIFVSAALGLVFNISHYTEFRLSKNKGVRNDHRSSGRRNGRPHFAAVSRRP
jgi:cell division protein FtsW